MAHAILADIQHNRKRLEYYSQMRARHAPPTPSKKTRTPQEDSIAKWIEIYSDRVKKLERKAQRMGISLSEMPGLRLGDSSSRASERLA